MTASAVKNAYLKLPFVSESRTVDEPKVNEREVTDAIPLFDEGDLVRRAQMGEAGAFERLYEMHVRRMYALCLRMVTDHRRAEDVLGDALRARPEKLPAAARRSLEHSGFEEKVDNPIHRPSRLSSNSTSEGR